MWTERRGVVVTTRFCTRGVLDSNLGPKVGHDKVFRGFLQPLQENDGLVPCRLPPVSLPFVAVLANCAATGYSNNRLRDFPQACSNTLSPAANESDETADGAVIHPVIERTNLCPIWWRVI